MPPQLALLLCTIFVIWLLRLDRKLSPDVSPALWIPTLWIMLISSKPLGVWFPSNNADAGSGSKYDQIFILTLILTGILILVKRRANVSIYFKQNPWLFILAGYMFASIFWSDIMVDSLKRWIREVFSLVIMALVVVTARFPRQEMDSLLRRTVYILIPFSLLLIKYFPEYGVEFARWSGMRMWIGVATQKNGLGRLSMIAAFYLVWTLVKRWKGHDKPFFKYQNHVDLFLLFLSLYFLSGGFFLEAYSATAISSFTVGLIMFIYLLRMEGKRRFLSAHALSVIFLVIFSYGIITLFSGGSTVGGISSSLGREENLTGRTDVWAELLPVAMQQPLIGHGYGGFWNPEHREKFNISGAHSGYLDILLDLGISGLIIYAMLFIACCHKMINQLNNDYYWACLWICCVIMGLVHNTTESSYNSFASQLTALFLFLVFLSSAKTSDHDIYNGVT